MAPSEIKLPVDRQTLIVTWPDGEVQNFTARMLRSMSRSAVSIGSELDGSKGDPLAGLWIDSVEPVGVYAINIRFSDGYDRGIYPWEMLRSSGEFAAPDQQISTKIEKGN